MAPTVKAYIRLLRPYQWVKNILLFTPLFFSAQIGIKSLSTVLGAFFCFCLAASMGYIINDWVDRDRDKNHPVKCKRPFCTGLISGKQALIFCGLIFTLSLWLTTLFAFPAEFLFYLFLYLFLTVAYSLYLKRVIIFEIFVVAMGFVLRVLAGGAASAITISDWLFMTVFFMAMLISVAKRKTELQILTKKALAHRESLKDYTISYLGQLLWCLGGITLVTYALYTVEKGDGLVYSLIPATYGIVRFFYLTESGKCGDSIKALFEDIQLLLTTLLFFVFLSLKIYL